MRARHLLAVTALSGVPCVPAPADARAADAGWTPTLRGKIDSAAVVDRQVARGAGAGRTP
ncbi:hypothetical protein ACYF6T_07285 [Streptomyces sp. 7R007]